MRIVVLPSSEQLVCPYCHDALGGAAEACERCHTGYHAECAKLAVRCALLGCGGALVAGAAPGERFALVLVPPAEPTEAQEAALVSALAVSRWDAQQRLRSRVPLVAGFFARDRVEHVLDALEGAGLHVFALEARALAVRAPFVVRSARREGDRLLLASTRHEKRVLELGAPRFVVTGRQSSMTEKKYRTTEGQSVVAHRTLRSSDLTRFVHVWLPGEPSPVAFEQGELRDFAFLGEKKAASGFENLRVLGELLAAGQPSDSSLEALGETHLTHEGGVRADGATYSNRPWVLATSRLIAQAAARLASRPAD